MQQPAPVVMETSRPSLGQIGLLSIAAGFALLMLDLGDLAVVAGWLTVAIWMWSMVKTPRPSPGLSFLYGAGAVLITFWWPDGGWWWLAIPLLWAGSLLAIGSGLVLLAQTLTGGDAS